MRVTGLRASNFLPFRELQLNLDRGLTVVTGPNGVGKSSLGRAMQLAKDALLATISNDWSALERDYGEASHFGAESFTVTLEAQLDSQQDRAVIEAWGRAALVTNLAALESQSAASFARLLPEDLQTWDVLGSGALTVRHDRQRHFPWRVTWTTPDCVLDLRGTTLVPTHGQAVGIGWLDYLRSIGDPMAAPALADGELSQITFRQLLDAGRNEVAASSAGHDPEPDTVLELHRLLRLPLQTHSSRVPISFARVLEACLRGVVVSGEPQEYDNAVVDLASLMDVRAPASGTHDLGTQLLRLKTGALELRDTYRRVQASFTELTGRHLDVVEQSYEVGPGEYDLIAVPVVPTLSPDGIGVDLPLRTSGAGLVEAARLSVLLEGSDGPLLLDEPATNLSAVVQRRIVRRLRERATKAQTVVITHSAHLVPVHGPSDLDSIVRLARNAYGVTCTRRISDDVADLDQAYRLLAGTDLRDALFASAVLLTEGATEREALSVWLADLSGTGLPTPEEAHVVVYDVGSDQNVAKHANLLRELGIPVGALVDGPALRPGGPLRKLMAQAFDQPTDVGFEATKAAWAHVGVYSLADEFHDDRSKRGEIEAFFGRVNNRVWDELKARGKIRRGAAFAGRVTRPPEITEMWGSFLGHVALVHTPPSH